MSLNNTPKLSWANNLRAAATLGVIGIHASSYLTGSLGDIPQNHWVISIIMNTAVRWSVPVFVMLTGSFVLNQYNGELIPFFKKAFYKIVVPFLIWSVFYLLYNNGASLFGNALNAAQKLALVIEKLVTGCAVHLWYIYMIIGMYLVIPIFSKWTQTAPQKEIVIFLSFWFFLLFAYPFIDRYKNDFELNYFIGYIGYLVAGCYFFNYFSLHKLILWLLLMASIVGISMATYYVAFEKNVDHEMYLAPLTPGVFIMSASVFLLFKKANVQYPSWFNTIVNQICKYSYGIYLAHLVVLSLVDDYIISANQFNPIISIPIMSIICLSLSYFLIWVLRKIPFVGNWIG